jgi:hypothetical protein
VVCTWFWLYSPLHRETLPSPPAWGEREGTRRGSDGEGEVGRAAARFPHLTPDPLSAPRGGEGEFATVL